MEFIQLCYKNFYPDMSFYPYVFSKFYDVFAIWAVVSLVFLNHKGKSEIKHFILLNRNFSGLLTWHYKYTFN